jgi:hypothetical protein
MLPGRIVIEDRKNKTAEAFSFGGDVEIQTIQGLTRVVFKSPAPILSLGREQSNAYLLAQEAEVLLAERRAAWGNDEDGYEKRLAETDPLGLYHSILEMLRERFRHYPSTGNDAIQEFVHFLNVESRTLESGHNSTGPARPLDQLL